LYVREYMKSPVITVAADMLLDDASRLMYEKGIKRLPVVENGKLVGLVTRTLLREAVPTTASPLSIYGTIYQLSKMKVRDVMITDVVTVTPDMTVEAAAALGAKKRVGTLPVVDKGGSVVGIFTSTDLHRVLTETLGFGQKGVRIRVSSEKGVNQGQVMEALMKHKTEFISAFWEKVPGTNQRKLNLHLAAEEVGEIVDELAKSGFEVEVEKS